MISDHLAADDLHNPDNDENFPDWMETERQVFVNSRDKNKDGKLDKHETMEWILAPDLSYADAEAKHLLTESDANKVRMFPLSSFHLLVFGSFTCRLFPFFQDGNLSKKEILNNHDMFVGSQVTNYGEALRRHDEF